MKTLNKKTCSFLCIKALLILLLYFLSLFDDDCDVLMTKKKRNTTFVLFIFALILTDNKYNLTYSPPYNSGGADAAEQP